MIWFDNVDITRKIEIGYDSVYEQPYWVKVDFRGSRSWEEYTNVRNWVSEKFGAKTSTWNNPRWSGSNSSPGKYWFKYEKDRTIFVLRWS